MSPQRKENPVKLGNQMEKIRYILSLSLSLETE